MVLILCILSNDAIICIKFHKNILEGIKVIEQTRFSLEKNQRA